MIDFQTIERIKSVANIVEVISEFVSLRKSGTNYKCLCPFHNEKTPSFMVSPSKGIFKCFSCGAGGDAVRFLMMHEQLSYPDALRWLAKKYGIEIHEKEMSPEETEAKNLRSSLFIVNNWACEYFQDNLYNTPDGQAIGLAYFRKRGFRDDIIKKFQLGYSLSAPDALSTAAKAKGYNLNHLEKVGLCYKRDDGRLRDRFQGRVMFPVHAIDGKIVAFGGRVLNTENKNVGKYVNSPESEIYVKRNELYGLYLAKKAIQKNDQCFLVEGYADVISMHQSGIENVVASSGTSLTYEQIHLIKRFTKNLTVLYDGDIAGIKASLRGINMLLEEGMNIKVLLLPDGHDPDDFAKSHTASEFVEYINSHQVDFIHFKIDILMKDCGNDPFKRGQVVSDIVESISLIPDPVVRAYYIKECGGLMDVDEKILINKTNSVRKIHFEEQKRQKEQAERRQQYLSQSAESNTATDIGETATGVAPETAGTVVSSIQAMEIQHDSLIYQREYALIKAILRYGERSMGTAEDGSGEVTVLQFIREEMESDGLKFETPLFQRIMDECVEHMERKGFVPSEHFVHHQTTEFVELAATMLADKYSLSETFAKERNLTSDIGDLNHSIPLMVVDLKWAIVTTQIKELMSRLQSVSIPEVEQRELMEQYQELKEIQRQLQKFLNDK